MLPLHKVTPASFPWLAYLYFVGNSYTVALKKEQREEIEQKLKEAVDGRLADPPIRTVLNLNGFHFSCDMLIGYTFGPHEAKETLSERHVKAAERIAKIVEMADEKEKWKTEDDDAD